MNALDISNQNMQKYLQNFQRPEKESRKYIKNAKLLNFKLLQHDNKLYFSILKNTKKNVPLIQWCGSGRGIYVVDVCGPFLLFCKHIRKRSLILFLTRDYYCYCVWINLISTYIILLSPQFTITPHRPESLLLSIVHRKQHTHRPSLTQ